MIYTKDLTIINFGGKLATDSREVAEMVETQHKDLLEKIRTYIKYLIGGKFRPSDFFIESSYMDKYDREQPCFLLTRKGCDMVANKTTGEKGVLFTATYVTKFEEMEEELHEDYSQAKQLPVIEEMQVVKFIADDLGVNTASRIIMYEKACENVGMKTNFLPQYVDGRILKALKTLLEQFNIGMSSIAFNKLLLEKGFVEIKERPSATKGTKKYKFITDKGLKYGENHKSPKNILETQPLWYEATFQELINEVLN